MVMLEYGVKSEVRDLDNMTAHQFLNLPAEEDLANIVLEFTDLRIYKIQFFFPPNDILHMCPRLITFELHEGRLTIFPDFSNNPNIEGIYLEHNMIESISENDVFGLKYLKNLYLTDNRVTQVGVYTETNFDHELLLTG